VLIFWTFNECIEIKKVILTRHWKKLSHQISKMEEMSSAFAVAFDHARVVFQFASLGFFTNIPVDAMLTSRFYFQSKIILSNKLICWFQMVVNGCKVTDDNNIIFLYDTNIVYTMLTHRISKWQILSQWSHLPSVESYVKFNVGSPARTLDCWCIER